MVVCLREARRPVALHRVGLHNADPSDALLNEIRHRGQGFLRGQTAAEETRANEARDHDEERIRDHHQDGELDAVRAHEGEGAYKQDRTLSNRQ